MSIPEILDSISHFQKPNHFGLPEEFVAAKTLATVGSSMLFGAHKIVQCFRHADSPFLYSLGVGTGALFCDDVALSLTAHVVAIAHRVLLLKQAAEDLTFSLLRLKSIQLLPTPVTLAYFLFEKSSKEEGELSLAEGLKETTSFFLFRMETWIEYAKESLADLLSVTFRLYQLSLLVFWNKEEAQEARSDFFLNAKECCALLFDQQEGGWEEGYKALEKPLLALFTSLKLEQPASLFLECTHQALKWAETAYHHLPSTSTLQSLSQQGEELLLSSSGLELFQQSKERAWE